MEKKNGFSRKVNFFEASKKINHIKPEFAELFIKQEFAQNCQTKTYPAQQAPNEIYSLIYSQKSNYYNYVRAQKRQKCALEKNQL